MSGRITLVLPAGTDPSTTRRFVRRERNQASNIKCARNRRAVVRSLGLIEQYV
jgi:peptide subunit release factor 1 (eRF1)